MKTWKLEITVKVADSWVTDGFDLKERLEQIEEQLTTMLPFAYEHELQIKARIVSAPDRKVIEQLQNGDVNPKD